MDDPKARPFVDELGRCTFKPRVSGKIGGFYIDTGENWLTIQCPYTDTDQIIEWYFATLRRLNDCLEAEIERKLRDYQLMIERMNAWRQEQAANSKGAPDLPATTTDEPDQADQPAPRQRMNREPKAADLKPGMLWDSTVTAYRLICKNEETAETGVFKRVPHEMELFSANKEMKFPVARVTAKDIEAWKTIQKWMQGLNMDGERHDFARPVIVTQQCGRENGKGGYYKDVAALAVQAVK